MMEGMRSIGYDVLGVGEGDLAGGIPDYLQAAQEGNLPVTSASFFYRDSGEPLFAPFAVRSYTAAGREVKVGYVSLSGFNSAFAKEGPDRRIVIMRRPAEALQGVLPSLRRRADLVVLLANLSLRDLEEALGPNPGVDLVLAAFGGRVTPAGRLETIAGVPVLYCGDQGKRLGEIRIALAAGKDDGKPAMTSSHVWLTRRYPSEPKLQKLIDETIARVNEANRRMAEARAAVHLPVTPQAPLRAPEGVEPRPGEPVSRKPFLTSTACQGCHDEAWQVYQASGHAHAFETLRKANQDYNPECVSCHVTGFNEMEGFLDARRTPQLINVQCEACHGNASEHARDPSRPFGAVPPRRCFTCHTKENSPDFVFFKYWEAIKH